MARILVCDDAMFMRKLLTDHLVKLGYQVVGEAETGMEAVERHRALRPDVVTMDITMPEMDGIEAVGEIIAQDPKAKIVMISAMGQEAMVREAIKRGAKDFIVKPFQKERVDASLKKVLGSVA